MAKLNYLMALLEDTKWNMMPQTVEAIRVILTRDEDHGDLTSAFHGTSTDNFIGNMGAPISGLKLSTLHGSTGVLFINGPMVPRAGMFHGMSGPELASYERIAGEFSALESMPQVKNILIVQDTPGGAVHGLEEVASLIRNSTKSTQTYIMGYCASAGYYLATATNKIYIAESGEAGSIGTVMIYTDTKAADEKKGYKTIEIVSSMSPNKRITPDSEAGLNIYQAMVDKLGMQFVNKVAEGRKVSAETVMSTFGKGGMLIGADAKSVGMVDEVITLKALLERNEDTTYNSLGGMMADTNTAAPISAEDFKAANPAAYNELLALGATNERERIKSIESIDHPDAQQFVAAAKYDASATKDSVTMAFAQHMLSQPKAPKVDDAHANAARGLAVNASDIGKGTPTSSVDSVASLENDLVAAMAAGGNKRK